MLVLVDGIKKTKNTVGRHDSKLNVYLYSIFCQLRTSGNYVHSFVIAVDLVSLLQDNKHAFDYQSFARERTKTWRRLKKSRTAKDSMAKRCCKLTGMEGGFRKQR